MYFDLWHYKSQKVQTPRFNRQTDFGHLIKSPPHVNRKGMILGYILCLNTEPVFTYVF